MKYCSKCQMKVQNQLNNCPLCGQSLESVEFSAKLNEIIQSNLQKNAVFLFENPLFF